MSGSKAAEDTPWQWQRQAAGASLVEAVLGCCLGVLALGASVRPEAMSALCQLAEGLPCVSDKSRSARVPACRAAEGQARSYLLVSLRRWRLKGDAHVSAACNKAALSCLALHQLQLQQEAHAGS